MNRLRLTLFGVAIRVAEALRGRPKTIGCHACAGPFRTVYLSDGEAACDLHPAPFEGDEIVEFAAPFQPMDERRFFLLLEAADEGWLPAGARLIPNKAVAR